MKWPGTTVALTLNLTERYERYGTEAVEAIRSGGFLQDTRCRILMPDNTPNGGQHIGETVSRGL